MDSAKKKKKERADIRIDREGGAGAKLLCGALTRLGTVAKHSRVRRYRSGDKQPPTQSPPGCLNTAAGCRN